MAMSFKEHLIQNIHKKEHDHAHNKTGIVTVSTVCAISILKKDLADDAFVDILEDKVKVEILDLQKGSLVFRISKTLSVKDDSDPRLRKTHTTHRGERGKFKCGYVNVSNWKKTLVKLSLENQLIFFFNI
uniref:Uncharacterized protein n=1 Tax=Chelonoidis abingdonii TaxID=106734 RepID=A0A8C0GPB9_CHEAB